MFIGLDGSFAPWVGALIPDLMQPILIIATEGREKEVVMRLARVGYDNALGYLDGGMQAWKAAGKEIDQIETIDVEELTKQYQKHPEIQILDVRKPGEFEAEHIGSASNLPLDFLNDNMDKIDRETTYYMHCRSGYRSTIAASILKARGFERLINVQGAFDDISGSVIPTVESVCASTK